jgi:hypothetical protein
LDHGYLVRFLLPEARLAEKGGRLDWGAGEAILALAWAGLFVPWGIMAYKMVGRS